MKITAAQITEMELAVQNILGHQKSEYWWRTPHPKMYDMPPNLYILVEDGDVRLHAYVMRCAASPNPAKAL